MKIIFLLANHYSFVVQIAHEIKTNFLSQTFLHYIIVVLQCLQLSRCQIQLIDHLVTLTKHLRVHNLIDILQKMFALLLVVERLHLFDINQVMVLIFSQTLSFASASQLFFTVLD